MRVVLNGMSNGEYLYEGCIGLSAGGLYAFIFMPSGLVIIFHTKKSGKVYP